jgi:polysaccharide export outer membrane protein
MMQIVNGMNVDQNGRKRRAAQEQEMNQKTAMPVARRLGLFVILTVLTVAWPCRLHAQAIPSSTTPALTQEAVQSKSGDDRPVLQTRNSRYKIQPGDGITISFPLTPEFNQPSGCTSPVHCWVEVQPDGYISVEGVGALHVAGMTVPEIVQALTKVYAGTLHNPIIHVDLVDFQRPFFLISGQVMKPGQYDMRYDTTLSNAIAVAGGFAPTAKTQVFLFHRVSPDWVEVKKVNVKEMLHGKNVNEDIHLNSGDMVFVPEKFITNFRKYVPYSITGTAGSYLEPN